MSRTANTKGAIVAKTMTVENDPDGPDTIQNVPERDSVRSYFLRLRV